MSKLFYGSVDFSKLLEMAKAGNKAFSKAQNGKIYLNLNVWINDEVDQYGNKASIQTNFKDAPKEEKVYVGNLKESEFSSQPVSSSDIPDESDFDNF